MKAPNGYGGIVKLKGNRRKPFQVRITTRWEIAPNGKPKQVIKTLGYFEKRKDAMLALAEYNANPYNLDTVNITFKEAWENWTPKYFKTYPNAETNLRSTYKRCKPLYDMKLKDIKAHHLQAVMDTVAHMSEETQTKLKFIFKRTFKYALENDVVNKDYSQFVTITPKKKDVSNKYFTSDELQLVFDNLDYTVDFPISKKRYASLNLTDSLIMMLYTGVRVGELLNIKVDDVDLENKTINVEGTKTKNAKRVVPIHDKLIPILNRNLNGTYLIENANGKPIHYDQYKKYFFDPYMKFLGLTHTPHALRHTFASLMDSAGVSASSVALKRIMGHANSSVTEHYTHKEIQELLKEINKLKV